VAGAIPVAAGEDARPGRARPDTVEAIGLERELARAMHVEKRATRSMTSRKRRLSARKRMLALPPKKAICHVFRGDCKEALAVARCESRFQTDARNGQYLGLFQMGAYERRRFGHGETPYEQAKAAHRYYVLSGKDWSPWTCKPWW
jgi:hypothetical protein